MGRTRGQDSKTAATTGGEGKPCLTLPSQASAVLLVRADSLHAGGRLLAQFG
jgi:hypothetical protein